MICRRVGRLEVLDEPIELRLRVSIPVPNLDMLLHLVPTAWQRLTVSKADEMTSYVERYRRRVDALRGADPTHRMDLYRACVYIALFDRVKHDIVESLALDEATIMDCISHRKNMARLVASSLPDPVFLQFPQFAPWFFVLAQPDLDILRDTTGNGHIGARVLDRMILTSSELQRRMDTVVRNFCQHSAVGRAALLDDMPVGGADDDSDRGFAVFSKWARGEVERRSDELIPVIQRLIAEIRRLNSRLMEVQRRRKAIEDMKLSS
eukprot:ANDGO_05809.mRNA.1 hypothetical protein